MGGMILKWKVYTPLRTMQYVAHVSMVSGFKYQASRMSPVLVSQPLISQPEG